MSLIIHTIVPEGIVVSSDTRTTCKDKGSVRYSDTAEKIIPFPNRIVVSHCGDSKIKKELSVTDFLLQLRNEFKEQSTINSLPLLILSEYKKQGGLGNTIFLVSGYSEFSSYAFTYRIETKNNQIIMQKGNGDFGSCYGGVTSITHAIMNSDINYNNLSIKEAIELTECCLKTNIIVSKFQKEQSIGGECQTYVIDKLHGKVGWIKKGEFKQDKNVLDSEL